MSALNSNRLKAVHVLIFILFFLGTVISSSIKSATAQEEAPTPTESILEQAEPTPSPIETPAALQDVPLQPAESFEINTNQPSEVIAPENPAPNFIPCSMISLGTNHTCAITTSGGAKCWGYNLFGQLGNGTTTDLHTPDWVSGMTSDMKAVATGDSHSCALTTTGGVKCWGYNYHGQLGNGTTTDRHTPGWVSGMTSGIKAISVGYYHTCALTTTGGVKCWGYNYHGQLGNGTTTNRHTPGWVSGMTSGIQSISTGGFHTCALTTSGGVKCWGLNDGGQLGNGTTTNQRIPVWVSGMTSGIQSISTGGYHTCALTTSGGVKCWGRNRSGQLGNGSTTNYSTPVLVSGMISGIQSISTGGFHTCALTTSGGVKCWGANNVGQLGNGTTIERHVWGWVSAMTSGIKAISTGEKHTCSLTTSGGSKCWGYNTNGEVGDGTTTERHTPVWVTW